MIDYSPITVRQTGLSVNEEMRTYTPWIAEVSDGACAGFVGRACSGRLRRLACRLRLSHSSRDAR